MNKLTIIGNLTRDPELRSVKRISSGSPHGADSERTLPNTWPKAGRWRLSDRSASAPIPEMMV